MAENNDLYKAYSILGSATTAEYNRRRKEEDKYRRDARKDKYLSYLAAPLLKGAGDLITSGVESLIMGPEEKKYNAFLNSETALIEKRKQESGYKIAKSIIADNEQALLDPQGDENYYANKRYERLLENFRQTYDEQEFDESAETLLREESKKWTAQNINRIRSQVEKAYRVKSPEEYNAIFGDVKPRTPGKMLADGVSKFFTGKDKRALQEEKINLLIEQEKITRDSLLEARRSLGYEAPVSELAGVAERLDDLKYKQEDWIETSSELIYKSLPVAGKTFTVSYTKKVFQHPEKNRTETKLVPADERSREFLKQGKLGQVQESVTTKNALGQQVTTLITKSYTTSGVEIVNTTESKTKLDSTLAAEQMSPGQKDVVVSSFNNVLRSLPSKNGKSIEVGKYLESDIEGMEATLAPRVFGLSRELATQNLININPSQSYELASAMMLRSIDSEIEDPGFMRSFKVNPLKNNGLGLAGENRSLHILDAFYSLENSGVSNVGISKAEEQLLLEGAKDSKGEPVSGTGVYDAFIKLDKRSREVMLNNLPPQFKSIVAYGNTSGRSYYDLFKAVHPALTH
jgi:hypothetical protein